MLRKRLRRAESWFAFVELLILFHNRHRPGKVGIEQPKRLSKNIQNILGADPRRHRRGGRPLPPDGRDNQRRWKIPDLYNDRPNRKIVKQLVRRLDAAKDGELGPAGDYGIAAAALIMAQQIMRYPFHRFDDDFWCSEDPEGVPSHTLEQLRLFPQHLWNPKTALGQKVSLNTPRHKRPNRGKASGVRLPVEFAEDVTFEVSTRGWDLHNLCGDSRPLVVATCHPNWAGEEYHTPAYAESSSFSNFGPVHAQRQLWLLKEQLRQAVVDEGAAIVVIPEYALLAEHRSLLKDHIARLLDQIALERGRRALLVVGGSAAIPLPPPGVQPDEPPVNEAIVWYFPQRKAAESPVTIFQEKCNPAPINYKIPEHATPQELDEWITQGTVIRIFRTPLWVVAVLICRDAADQAIRDQLADLGVNLCLVPSYSDKTQPMVDIASELCAASQAVLVLANAPANTAEQPVDNEAAFGAPLAGNSLLQGSPRRGADDDDSWRAAGSGIWLWTVGPEEDDPIWAIRRRWKATITPKPDPAAWLKEFADLVNSFDPDDFEETMARLLVLQSFPATMCRRPAAKPEERWTFDSGDDFESALLAWLMQRPHVTPEPVDVKPHGLLRVLAFTWRTPGQTLRQGICILARQADGGYLGIFHDPYSPEAPVEDKPHPSRPATPEGWEQTFTDLFNEPQNEFAETKPERETREHAAGDTADMLAKLYTPYAVYMHKPSRAIGPHRDNAELEKGLRAILVRVPKFRLVPDADPPARYGVVAIQACRWWLHDMARFDGEKFHRESGDSTVVLVRESDGGWICLHDDPFGLLLGAEPLIEGDPDPPPPSHGRYAADGTVSSLKLSILE